MVDMDTPTWTARNFSVFFMDTPNESMLAFGWPASNRQGPPLTGPQDFS